MNLKSPAVFLACLFLCWATVLTAGLSSQVSLGDEVHHYEFAKDSFTQGGRPLLHSLYRVREESSIQYTTDPAWPLLLAGIWKLAGGISFQVAQIYHSLFYLLLVFMVYAAALPLYGNSAAVWAALLSMTTPMLVSFGVLFYTDLPATAVLCASFVYLLRRNYFFAGILMTLAFLFKKTTALFLPPVLILIIIAEHARWKKIPLCLFFYLLLPVTAILHERTWISHHFDSLEAQGLLQRLNVIYKAGEVPLGSRLADMFTNKEFSNSSIYNSIDHLKYFGCALMVGLFFYLWKKYFNRKDLVLWACILFYVVSVFFLRLIPDLRYLMLVSPFLCVLAGKALAKNSSKPVAGIIILMCVIQFFTTAFYVNSQRRIPISVAQAFAWIENNTPTDSVIMYPELNILEYAHRPMMWGLFKIRKIFWGTSEEQKNEIQRVGLDYIAVLKSRVYDDSKVHHIGGYPASFVERLPSFSFASKVYENEKMAVWKINSELLQS